MEFIAAIRGKVSILEWRDVWEFNHTPEEAPLPRVVGQHKLDLSSLTKVEEEEKQEEETSSWVGREARVQRVNIAEVPGGEYD